MTGSKYPLLKIHVTAAIKMVQMKITKILINANRLTDVTAPDF